MSAKEEFIEIYRENIRRDGADALLDYLEHKSDFFTAPASARFHGAYAGGLCEHSVNVYHCLTAYLERERVKELYGLEYPAESAALVSLLHDVCKTGCYRQGSRNVKGPDGKWQAVPTFFYEDPLPYGHGEKSVYILSGFLRLTREEAMAIRWHMGFSGDEDKRLVGQALQQYPLAFALSVADMEATYVLSKEEDCGRANRENDLGRDPIGKLLLRLAVPTVTAQLVNALYNIVDRIYIGHIPGEGDLALTGLGICFPVILFVSAISALVGMGGGSRAVVRMGEGKLDEANKILGNCTLLLMILGLAATVVFQLCKEPMLYLFGATENTIGYSMDYLNIYLYGSIFVELALGLNFFITSQGFSTVGMASVIIGAVVNIVLDPILIFGLNMGVKGAALATITAQAVSAVWVVRFLCGRRTKLRIQRRLLRLDAKVLAPVLALGLSPFIMQSTESLVNIAFNSSLKTYGGDPAVGAMTICSSIMQVFSLLFQGLSQGAQPIVGYNYGAGQLDRVKRTFRLLFFSSLCFSCAACAALELFPGLFVSLFNDKPELVEIAVWALHIYAAGMFMLGVQFSCQQTFVALGQTRVSLFLALLRKVILLIPLILLLPRFLSDQVFAVFLAEPVADILAATTTGAIFFWRLPRILEKRRLELEHRPI